MNFTTEQLAKAKQAKSADELLVLAKESGIELTEMEAKKYCSILNTLGELHDDELENVAGGCGEPEKPIYTAMICDNCGCNTFWRGNYVNGIMYKCNMCEHETFHGTYTTDHLNW